MKKEQFKYHKKGISLKLVTSVISIFVFLISTALIVSLVLITNENNKVMQANTNYIAIKQASNDVQLASDSLHVAVQFLAVKVYVLVTSSPHAVLNTAHSSISMSNRSVFIIIYSVWLFSNS